MATPDVSAFVVGAELVTSGLPTDGQVRDAIGPLLDGFVTSYGGHLLDVTHIDDDLDATIAALDADVDVIVVSGGTSAGPTDYLRAALHRVGAALVVDGVDVRPGHPMLLAQLPRGRFLVGLPGNPLAAVAGIVTLLWPLLDGMHRRALRPLPCSPLEVHGGNLPRMTTLHPALLTAGGLRLLPHAGPAMLRGLARADVLAVFSAGDGVPGAPVPYVPLPPGRR